MWPSEARNLRQEGRQILERLAMTLVDRPLPGPDSDATDADDRRDRNIFYLPRAGAETFVHSGLSDPWGVDEAYGLDAVMDPTSAKVVQQLSDFVFGPHPQEPSDEEVASFAAQVFQEAWNDTSQKSNDCEEQKDEGRDEEGGNDQPNLAAAGRRAARSGQTNLVTV